MRAGEAPPSVHQGSLARPAVQPAKVMAYVGIHNISRWLEVACRRDLALVHMKSIFRQSSAALDGAGGQQPADPSCQPGAAIDREVAASGCGAQAAFRPLIVPQPGMPDARLPAAALLLCCDGNTVWNGIIPKFPCVFFDPNKSPTFFCSRCWSSSSGHTPRRASTTAPHASLKANRSDSGLHTWQLTGNHSHGGSGVHT